MNDAVYKMVELVGTATTSIEDAIQQALTRASKTLQNLDWFEVIQTRGCIENGRVRYYQVILKVGFRINE